jgi:vacuolar-type H+-ATPase subunit I/STV1
MILRAADGRPVGAPQGIPPTSSTPESVLLSQFTENKVWSWVVGALTLMAGIAIVAFHQYWRSAAAVIISALGWVLLARSLLLLAFPDAFASLGQRVIGAVGIWQTVYAALAVVGLYLTYVGWLPTRTHRHHKASSPTAPDLPRAA